MSPTPSVARVMTQVLVALLPGIAAHVGLFGPGILFSLVLCAGFGLLFEAAILKARDYPLRPFLGDGTTLVTAALLALTLPTLLPWWLYAVGMLFATVVGKHLYGGLGQNTFNPAMLGFAVLIISFPAQINVWPAPAALAAYSLSLSDTFDMIFNGARLQIDAYSAATPLDSLKSHLRSGQDAASLIGTQLIPDLQARDLVALSYLLGGLYLLARRIITWHIPVAFLGGIALTSGALYLIDPSHQAGPIFHLIVGGTLLGAFFIATDPVSAANTPMGKLIYAGLAGLITVMIRSFGSFPDGIAFAILLMNSAAPLIDAYTQPKVFGHTRRHLPGDKL